VPFQPPAKKARFPEDVSRWGFQASPNFEIIKPIIGAFWNIHRIVIGPLKGAYDHLFKLWQVAVRMGEPYNTNPSINSMLTKAIQMYEYFSWLVEDNLRLIEKFKSVRPFDFTFINPYIRNERFNEDMQAYQYYENELGKCENHLK